MAEIKGIFQQFSPANSHSEVLNTVAVESWVRQITFSVAYVRQEGVIQIKKNFSPHAVTAFVGCSNGATSIQGVLELLSFTKVLYVIDTANPGVIFHPKAFLFEGEKLANIILGSANLTLGGLHNNFEIGIRLALDLSVPTENQQFSNFSAAMMDLPKLFPTNVTRIQNIRDAVRLFRNGLLVDERTPLPRINGKVKTRNPVRRTAINVSITRSTINRKRRNRMVPLRPTLAIQSPSQADWILLWTSKELTKRDLCIPTGKNTNPTGSMLFKKGLANDIDQRSYFRNEIFQNLAWAIDPKKTKWERAVGRFYITIQGVDQGVFDLMLSHNTDTKSKSYKQNNSMTQLHWGKATSLVKQPALLGHTLKLFKSNLPTGEFIISIE